MAVNSLKLVKSDFQNENLHVEENRLYFYWFQFLVLSPSYELARRYRENKGKITKAEKTRLPKDFKKVLEIYDAFGNVQQYLFKIWLVERGVELFGIPGKPAKVTPLFKVSNNAKTLNKVAINNSLNEYFEKTWPSQNKPGAMVLAIPLHSTRQKILKDIKTLLDRYLQAPPPNVKPKFELVTKNVHMENIIDSLSVLWNRSAKPDWPLWKLGEECKIRKARQHRCYEPDAITEKRALEQMTSRKLKTAQYIAENAARGIFPSQTKPTHFVKFDPVEFCEILTRHNRWVKKEKSRLLAQTPSN